MSRFEVQDLKEEFDAVEQYGSDGSIAIEENGGIYQQVDFGIPAAAVDSWRYTYVKRVLDFVLSSLLTSILFVPCCIIAVAILATSDGPVFYREDRIGRYGRVFRIWKFRSMCNGSAHANSKSSGRANEDHFSYRMCKDQHDPRITKVGRFLRNWSLDELPQIINVLRGEMSLIGPRPIVAKETPLYEKLLPYYLAVTPGLSGLWQVSGRSNIDYPKRAQLDAAYVLDWNLLADLRILVQTIPAVLKRTGAR